MPSGKTAPARSDLSEHIGGGGSRKIVFVAAVAPTLVHFVAPVAEALRDRGWETVGVAVGAQSVKGFDRVYDLPPFRRRGLLSNLSALRAISKILSIERPDVAHLHTPAAVALGRVAAFRRRIPSISVVHGTFLEARQPVSSLFAIAEFPLAWMSRRTVVVNSDDGRFYERCCRRERVVLAPAGGAGVNVQLSAGDRPTVPLALYLGRLAADKNLDFLVSAWELAKNTSKDLRLRIVGDSVDGDPPWKMPEEEGIEHARWTNDPAAEIAKATLLVTASRREGFSMAVAEAVCVGIPVVAVENRGTREIFRQIDSGLTLTHLDREPFAAAMAATAAHGERRPRPDLIERWGRDATVKFHVQIIEDVVTGTKATKAMVD